MDTGYQENFPLEGGANASSTIPHSIGDSYSMVVMQKVVKTRGSAEGSIPKYALRHGWQEGVLGWIPKEDVQRDTIWETQ